MRNNCTHQNKGLLLQMICLVSCIEPDHNQSSAFGSSAGKRQKKKCIYGLSNQVQSGGMKNKTLCHCLLLNRWKSGRYKDALTRL